MAPNIGSSGVRVLPGAEPAGQTNTAPIGAREQRPYGPSSGHDPRPENAAIPANGATEAVGHSAESYGESAASLALGDVDTILAGTPVSGNARAHLAAVMTQTQTDPSIVRSVLGALTADRYTSAVTTPDQRLTLAAAAVEGGRTGQDAVAAFNNVSADVWGALLGTRGRIDLAAAALRVGATGTDVVRRFGNVSADPYVAATLTQDERVGLAVAAVEGGRTGADAVAIYNNIGVASLEDPTLDLARDRAILTAGTLRSGRTSQEALGALRQIELDPYAGTVTSTTDRVRLSVAALESGRTGTDAATALNNVSADPYTYTETTVSQRVSLAAMALRGGRTGIDAARAFNNVSADPLVSQLDTDTRVRLTAAGLQHGLRGLDVAYAMNDIADDPYASAVTNRRQGAVLAAALLQALDTSSQSPLLGWMYAGDSHQTARTSRSLEGIELHRRIPGPAPGRGIEQG